MLTRNGVVALLLLIPASFIGASAQEKTTAPAAASASAGGARAPAAPDPLRILAGEFASVRRQLEEAEATSAQGRFADAGRTLENALGAIDGASPNPKDPMQRYLAEDLVLGRLIDNSELRADDEAQLRWLEKRRDARRAFWGEDANAALAAQNAWALQLCKVGRCQEAIEVQEAVARKTLQTQGAGARNTLVARHNLGVALGQAGRYAEALALSRELAGEAEARWGANDPTTLRFRNSVAANYTDLGQYADALIAHEAVYRARQTALGPAAPDTLSSLGSLAATYGMLSRTREAQSLSQQGHDLARRTFGPAHPRTQYAASALAIDLRRAGRLGEARALSQQAWDTLSSLRGARHPETLYAMNVHASVLDAQGDHAEAVRVTGEALQMRREVMGEMHPLTLAALRSAGRARLSAGDAAGALALLTQAHEGYVRLLGDAHPETLLALIDRMSAALQADQLDSVRPFLPAYVAHVESLRAQHGLSPKSRRTLFERYVEGYRHYALASLRGGEADRAFELAELSKARTLLEGMALQRANRSGALPADAQQAIALHEARLAALDRNIDAAAGQADRRQQLESERNIVVRAYADLQTRLRARYPKYRQLAEAPKATLADARRLLPADTLFISYLVDGARVMAFAVDRSGLRHASELAPAPDLAATVEAFRKLSGDALEPQQAVWQTGPGSYRLGLRHKPPAPGAVAVDDAAPLGALLSAQLLEPMAALIRSHDKIVVAPDAALALLPFEALPFDGRPMAGTRELSYIQSLSMLAALASRREAYAKLPSRRALLAFGNPVYSAAGDGDGARASSRSAAPGMVDREAAAQSIAESADSDEGVDEAIALLRESTWDNLPGTAREIDAVRRAVDRGRVDVVTGGNATERKLLDMDGSGQLARYRRLLFSVHGYLSTSVPALSALVLGQVGNPPTLDGYVTAAEWPAYTLRSDLVVMSACDTGVGKVVHGEGVMGLPYALYMAGNTSTVMTLWPVSDESTARFMEAFFRRLNAGEPTQQALAGTKRAFASGEHGETLRRPAYWAGFVLYGA